MKQFRAALLTAVLCMTSMPAYNGGAEATSQPKPGTEAPATTEPTAPTKPAPAEAVETNTASATGDPDKKVILVVSFGTSYNDTRAATIDAIEADIAAAFPEYEVRRAFTSQIIIDKLRRRDGLEIDNVTEAMERLVADGVGSLVIQPTHVIHGAEYDDMRAETGPYVDHFASLRYGRPLLSTIDDYEKVAEAIVAEYTPAEDTALVLMGHGTHHFANSAYAAMDYTFKDKGNPNVFVGTVEGYPEYESVSKWVKAGGYNKVTLAPLMIVAGDHATNDMAGDKDDSWKVMFKTEGKAVEPILKGMGAIVGVRSLFVEHVSDAIQDGAGADA